MNRADRKRQAKEDEKRLLNGIDADTNDASSTVAMARHLHLLLEKGKQSGSVDEAVKFLYAKAASTVAARPIAVACARGCSHCCNGWVSVSAPEILFAAKRVRHKGDALAERVHAAEAKIGSYAFLERPHHPNPCPMLEGDACGLYESRPLSCRMASSVNATACERVFRQLAPELIPAPVRHIKTRELYQLAITAALTHAGLPHLFYDFTGGLALALSREDAEAAWLAGEDIFADLRTDPTDLMTKGSSQLVYRRAFGEAQTKAPAALVPQAAKLPAFAMGTKRV
jgi:Fe-S-cluster containining protein